MYLAQPLNQNQGIWLSMRSDILETHYDNKLAHFTPVGFSHSEILSRFFWSLPALLTIFK
jgi:hypothetical protein